MTVLRYWLSAKSWEKKMDAKTNYTVVGIFVVVLTIAMIAFGLWLTSTKRSLSYVYYVTYLREEVSGLSEQNPVRFNGVKVGYVDSILLNDQDPRQVKIILAIEKGTPISTSTVAVLRSEGITGIDYVGLKSLTSDAPPLLAQKGQKYPVIPSEPSLLTKLSSSIPQMTEAISKLTADVNLVFDEKNRQAISASLANIQTITDSIAQNSQNINDTLKNTNIFMKNAADLTAQMPPILDQLKETMASVHKTSDAFGQTSKTITTAMQQTSNTVQHVGEQIVPSAQELITRLNTIAANLQNVSDQMKQNPSVIIRGRTPAALGPGEGR